MSFNELVADVLTNYAVAWQGSDGAECFGIAMELFNLIEQHVAEAVAREREECAKRKSVKYRQPLGALWEPGVLLTNLGASRGRADPKTRDYSHLEGHRQFVKKLKPSRRCQK